MKKVFFFISATLAVFASGCAGERGNVEGPFAQYSHETFIMEGTGETGLYIDNEPWYALMDLHGFRSIDMGVKGSDEFLSRKNDQDITITVSARKIDAVEDDASCRKGVHKQMPYRHTAKVEVRTLGDRKVLIHTVNRKKRIDYCPYYKGYCFDFEFSMNEKINNSAIQGILESIVFIEDSSMRSKIEKIFYIHDKKLQLSIPDKWKYTFKTGFQNTHSILFTPIEGKGFLIYLSPFSGFDGKTLSLREARDFLARRMAKWEDRAVEKPAVQDFPNEKITIAYFDVTDRYYHEGAANEYPYQRQGYAVIDGTILSFWMLYGEDSREDAGKALESLVHAKVMDLYAEPAIHLAK